MTPKKLQGLLEQAYLAGWRAREAVKNEAPRALDLTFKLGVNTTVDRLMGESKPQRRAW